MSENIPPKHGETELNDHKRERLTSTQPTVQFTEAVGTQTAASGAPKESNKIFCFWNPVMVYWLFMANTCPYPTSQSFQFQEKENESLDSKTQCRYEVSLKEVLSIHHIQAREPRSFAT